MDRVLRFDHRPGEEGAQDEAFERLARRAVTRLQEAPEGRELLRELLREYGDAGKTAVLRPRGFPGSAVVMKDGVERLVGTRAWTSAGACEFNRAFLDLADSEHAAEFLASVMAHELRHAVSHAQARRLSPDGEQVLSASFVNEQRARLTGYLVAARLASTLPTLHTEEAAALAQDPDAYWEQLKARPVYARFLDAGELADPIAAYRRRLRDLETARQGLLRDRDERLPMRLAALELMTRLEGLGSEADDLRREARADAVRLPQQIKDAAETISKLDLQVWLGEHRYEGLETDLPPGIASSPALRFLESRRERDQRDLLELLRDKALPSAHRDPRMLDWEGFWRLAQESQRRRPEPWRGFLGRFAPSV